MAENQQSEAVCGIGITQTLVTNSRKDSDRFDSALFSALERTHCTHVVSGSERVTIAPFIVKF